MVHYETPFIDVNDDIRQLAQTVGVAEYSVHFEKAGRGEEDGQHWSVFDKDIEGSFNGTESEDTTIYAIGSMARPFIVLLLCIIINKLSYSEEDEHKKYRAIRENWDKPWDTKFTDLFNFFSDAKIAMLPANPTLRHLVLDLNSSPPIKHVLFALDGTPIMSKQSFLDVVPRLAQAAFKDSAKPYVRYSDSNYIMVGYLIEAIGETSLGVLIDEHLCGPLGMVNTSIGASDNSIPRMARSCSPSADVTRKRVDHADTLVSAAFRAYSCTRDLAILFRAILRGLKGGDSYLTKDLVADFLKPYWKLYEDEGLLSLFGIYTSLNTSTPGTRSYNRLLAPGNKCSTYPLGYKGGDKEIQAYYLAGNTNGDSCSAYLLPKWKFFVIVLTKTRIPYIDASDHITRLILQKTFDLRFCSSSKLGALSQILRKRKDDGPESKEVVDIIKMASLAAETGKRLLQLLAAEDAEEDILDPRPLRLNGTYYNEQTMQSIVITDNLARIIGTASGALGTPQPMGIIRTGHLTMRLRPLSKSNFTIDRLDPDAWRNLNFELCVTKFKDGECVMSIKRQIPLFLEEFKRI